MKYIQLIPALLFGTLLVSCNMTQKLYEAQEYDQVIQRLAPNICAGDMNAKRINYVAASYHKANQTDHERIQALKASGQPDVWPEIYQRYCSMKGRNEALKCFPRQVKRGMNYVKLDLDEDLTIARNRAENYLVARASELLVSRTKADAEEAEKCIEQLKRTNRENERLQELQRMCLLRAADVVLLSIDNEDERPLLPEFEEVLFSFDAGEIPANVQFQTGKQKMKDIDTEVVIVVKDIQVSPVRLDEVTFKETNGEKIVEVTDHTQNKSVTVKGNLEYYSNAIRRSILPFEVKTTFKNDYTTIKGDRAACSEETLVRMNSRALPVPSDESILMDAAKKLNDLIGEELRK